MAENITGKILLSYKEYKRLKTVEDNFAKLREEFESYKKSHNDSMLQDKDDASRMEGEGYKGVYDGERENSDYTLQLPVPTEENVTPVTSTPAILVKSDPFQDSGSMPKEKEGEKNAGETKRISSPLYYIGFSTPD